MCTGISVNQTINAHQHASPCCQILQAVDPGAVISGLLDSHCCSVAQRLHHGKHAENSCLWRPIGIGEGLTASPSHTTGRTGHVSGGSMKQIPTAAQGSVVPFVRRRATGGRSTEPASATPAMDRVRTCWYSDFPALWREAALLWCAVAASLGQSGLVAPSRDRWRPGWGECGLRVGIDAPPAPRHFLFVTFALPRFPRGAQGDGRRLPEK